MERAAYSNELKIWSVIRALFSCVPGVPSPARPADLPEEVPSKGETPWLQIARQDLGIKEFPGPAANPEIMRAWKYCEYDPPNGDETAYCSAKMCEWMERSGLPSTRAPNARSWLKWGSKLDKPKPGCVVVFWRVSPTAFEGHVAIYVGPGSKPGFIKVLGANQSDGINIQEYSLGQLLGYRWPTTGGNSRTLKAQTLGLVGDGLTTASLTGSIIQTLPDTLALGDNVAALAAYWPYAAIIGITISILARMATIAARLSDWKVKGV